MPPTNHGPARYWAVDLHVHSPASADVVPETFGASSPEEIVAAALDAGLDAIAITDHNSVAWVARVAEAASGSELIVLPGMELSTAEGHLLGIWEEGTDTQLLKDTLVALKIRTKDHGKLDISTEVGFAAAAEEIQSSGGIAIAAHGDREKGILKLSVAAHRKKILQASALAAVEVVSLETVDKVARQVSPGEIACVRGSDCVLPRVPHHTISGIGHRRTWVKASRPDLKGIRHALMDPELRIRLNEPSPPDHPMLKRLTVSGGFLDGQVFDFSGDLTCLLGGTGTGKSLIVELLRFVLDQQTLRSDFPAIRDEVDRRLKSALGNHSFVELSLHLTGGPITLRRSFDEMYETETEVLVGDLDALPLIRAFSQGEIIEYAREPVGRMSLVDSGLDLTPIDQELAELYTQINAATEELFDARSAVHAAEEGLKELPSLRKRVKSLSDLFDDQLVKSQSGWTTEKSYFRKLDSMLDERSEFSLGPVPTFKRKAKIKANEDLHTRAKKALAQFEAAVASAQADVEEARQDTISELEAISEDWNSRYKAFDTALSKQIEKIRERR